MRGFIIVVSLLLLLAIGYVGYAHFSGGAVYTFGLPIGGERARIREQTFTFFEHIKFKNTTALSHLVPNGTDSEKITQFMTDVLGTNENDIDLLSVKIIDVELSSKKNRARAKVHLSGTNLRNKTPFDVTKIIFLSRSKNGDWIVDINNPSR